MAGSSEITLETIDKMVMIFYAKILKDEIVGPFFIEKLGDKIDNEMWKPHLVIIKDFWASIALGDKNYRGSPFAPHLNIEGISSEAFSQWLKLFFETLDTVYDEKIAALFKERSTIIAGNFMRNLGLAL